MASASSNTNANMKSEETKTSTASRPTIINGLPENASPSTPVLKLRSLKQTQKDIFKSNVERNNQNWEEQFEIERYKERILREECALELLYEKLEVWGFFFLVVAFVLMP